VCDDDDDVWWGLARHEPSVMADWREMVKTSFRHACDSDMLFRVSFFSPPLHHPSMHQLDIAATAAVFALLAS